MNPRAWLCGIVTALLLTTSGCGTKSVTVVNENEFNLMGRRITALLQDRHILNAEGGYVAALLPFSSFPSPVGGTLYEQLSPAFRFQVDARLLPPTFAASKTPKDSIKIKEDGFVMTQGGDTITVTLLGGADWNGDRTTDWFVLCRVESLVPPNKRDYYVVINNTTTTPMQAKTIAVYDCRNQTCVLFADLLNAAPAPEIVEVEAGQRTVIPAPGTDMPAPATGASDIKESKLGG